MKLLVCQDRLEYNRFLLCEKQNPFENCETVTCQPTFQKGINKFQSSFQRNGFLPLVPFLQRLGQHEGNTVFGKDKFLKATYFEPFFFLMHVVTILEILTAFVPLASLNIVLGMSSQF